MSKNYKEIGEVTLRRDKDKSKADRTRWTKRIILIMINPKSRNRTNNTIKLIDLTIYHLCTHFLHYMIYKFYIIYHLSFYPIYPVYVFIQFISTILINL